MVSPTSEAQTWGPEMSFLHARQEQGGGLFHCQDILVRVIVWGKGEEKAAGTATRKI
jgi:hypothetical protein